MTIDLDALEKLADEATPGPWTYDDNSPRSFGAAWVNSPDVHKLAFCDGTRRSETHGFCLRMDDDENEQNAAFIAAANPTTIKALIAELKEARKLLTRIDRVYADIQDGNGNHPTELRKVRAFLSRNGKGEG